MRVVRLIKLNGFVPRLLGSFQFFIKSGDNSLLDLFPALNIDGVGNVGMKFHASLYIRLDPIFNKLRAAIAAELGSKVVFPAAFAAMVTHFARGHGDK